MSRDVLSKLRRLLKIERGSERLSCQLVDVFGLRMASAVGRRFHRHDALLGLLSGRAEKVPPVAFNPTAISRPINNVDQTGHCILFQNATL